MMEKLLTVSVAAYNGADTLARALESCLVPDCGLLDVMIVDDGSTDDTAELARQWTQRHPECFRLIRKDNGGYGTTLNTALPAARGRFFRTLDCDDWFDRGALQTLLHQLQDCEADAVFTDYRTVSPEGPLRRYDVCGRFAPGRLYSLDETGPELCLEMHALTFRTDLLRSAWRELPDHCSYTDMAYTFFGMSAVQRVCFCPVVLYQYWQGREGQSVSMDSYRRHTADYIRVARMLLDAAEPLAGDSARDRLLQLRARDVAQYLIELYLRFPPGSDVARELRRYDTMLCREYPNIAQRMQNKNTRLLRAGQYLPYRLLSAWARNKRA